MECVPYIIPCYNCYHLAKQREFLREKQNIEGSFGSDCAMVLFCGSCVLCQHMNEMRAMNVSAKAPCGCGVYGARRPFYLSLFCLCFLHP